MTIARDVLRARRRIATQPSGWALSLDGVRSLLGQAWPEGLPGAQALPDGDGGAIETNGRASEVKSDRAGEAAAIDQQDPLAAEIAPINAALVRSEAVITDMRSASRRGEREKDPLVYDLDWDEDERLDEWRLVVAETEDMPPVLRAIVLLDAWNVLQVRSMPPGSAGFWRSRCSARPASRLDRIWPRSISA